MTVGCLKATRAERVRRRPGGQPGAGAGVGSEGADLAKKSSNMTRSEANMGVVEEYNEMTHWRKLIMILETRLMVGRTMRRKEATHSDV